MFPGCEPAGIEKADAISRDGAFDGADISAGCNVVNPHPSVLTWDRNE